MYENILHHGIQPIHIALLCMIFLDQAPQHLASIRRLKSDLADIIEPDFGLLDQLVRLEVLTRRQLAKVRSERTVFERSDALLDLLESEDQCDKFIVALQRTGQQHVANFLSQHGG